jgi:glycosyltransferase involved in cell wall biosynthesis
MIPTQVEKPVISVVLPTWNCAEMLREAIASVVRQSWNSWELIVINNSSTDHTKEVIASFKDNRIKVIDFNNNGIIAAARNQGIEHASGEFIAFLDSDDFWFPDKLQTCVDRMRQAEADVVCHGERHFRDGGDGKRVEWDVCYGQKQAITFKSLLYIGNFLSTSALLVRSDLIKKLGGFATEPGIVTAEDYDLWLKLMAEGCKVEILPQILGAYRIHPASASSSQCRHLRAVRSVVVRHHRKSALTANRKADSAFLMRMARLTASSCRSLAKTGDFRNSLLFAKESLTSLFS